MSVSKQDKQEWAEFHARQLAVVFKKWQDLHQIDNTDYTNFLNHELVDSYEDPLRKSLIESIVNGKRSCLPK